MYSPYCFEGVIISKWEQYISNRINIQGESFPFDPLENKSSQFAMT